MFGHLDQCNYAKYICANTWYFGAYRKQQVRPTNTQTSSRSLGRAFSFSICKLCKTVKVQSKYSTACLAR